MKRDVSKYVIDGVRLPSVTECLEMAGLSDYSGIPEAILERALHRGVDVDEWISAYELRLLDGLEPDERVAPYFEGYKRFKADTGFERELVQHFVHNKTYSYVGTLDLVGAMPKLGVKRALLDTKCVYAVRPEVGPQLALYALPLEEGGRIDGRYALQLMRDGTYRLIPFMERHHTHDALAAVRVAHWKIRNRRVEWPPKEDVL